MDEIIDEDFLKNREEFLENQEKEQNILNKLFSTNPQNKEEIIKNFAEAAIELHEFNGVK